MKYIENVVRIARANPLATTEEVVLEAEQRMARELRTGDTPGTLGHRHPKTVKQKMSMSHKGKPRFKWRYVVHSPKGRTYTTDNLRQLCRDFGLTQSKMVATANGQQPSHKGWTVKKLEQL